MSLTGNIRKFVEALIEKNEHARRVSCMPEEIWSGELESLMITL